MPQGPAGDATRAQVPVLYGDAGSE